MAYNASRRTAPCASRAHSVVSDSSFAATPRPTPPPTTRRAGMRAVRAHSIVSDAASYAEGLQPTAQPKRIPAHFTLAPTVPSPFTGSLEASLDAVLAWGNAYADTQAVVDVLLQEVTSQTNWRELLDKMIIDANEPAGRGRYLIEELLFLVTRTLLPEQIAENRLAMARLYDCKKQLAIRLVLRYDMLREWKLDAMHVPSLPPAGLPPPALLPGAQPEKYPNRRALMPNVLATLIAAPPGGFTTHGVRERMRHHVTGLDDHLLLTDERVAGWSDEVLVYMTSQIVLQWQWLRQNNEMLQEMEMYGWEELDGKADECDWIADDVKKPAGTKKEKGGASQAVKKEEE